MRIFATAVDRGSLASAARGLGYSPATVTRAIALLERRLGMPLMHRSTRALHLTQFGETYLATCREVLAALDIAERGAAAEQEKNFIKPVFQQDDARTHQHAFEFGQERRNSSYSSAVQKPMTCSTPARLYQLRSNRTISPAAGKCSTSRWKYHCVRSVSDGLLRATCRSRADRAAR